MERVERSHEVRSEVATVTTCPDQTFLQSGYRASFSLAHCRDLNACLLFQPPSVNSDNFLIKHILLREGKLVSIPCKRKHTER